jgi:hypothetical protein
MGDWRRNKDTEAFIDALSAFTGIPVIGLVESKVGGDEDCNGHDLPVAIAEKRL